MDTLVEDEHLRTSTPVESLDVPHLLDPGEDLSDSKGDDRETPDFVVRLGTSLARSEAGSQYKLLKKEFFLRPLDSQKVSKQHQSANSGGTSIRSSGRVSPIRRRSSVISLCNDNRRSSVTSISTEQNQRLLRRGLGRLRRRMSTKGGLFPPSSSPREDLTPREPVSCTWVFHFNLSFENCILYAIYNIIMYVDIHVFYIYSVSSSSGESPKVFWLCLESGYGSKGTCVFWRQILRIII